MENNRILQKLDGLEARFEEVSTLITDPDVIGDQQRFVKLTKEYKDLSDIMDVRKRYIACLNSISEAKDILANETDPEMKEMAREELATNEELQPKPEEEIKIALVPKDPEDAKNVQVVTRHASLQATSSRCTRVSVSRKAGNSPSRTTTKVLWAVSKKSTLPYQELMSMVR